MADAEGPKFCNFCDHNFPRPGEFACDSCLPKLKALMEVTGVVDHTASSTSYSPSISFKNVKLTTDYPGEAVVAIDGSGASGVQKPFRFDGQGKCIVCDELTTNTLVCVECSEAIHLARKIRNDNAGEFLHLFQDEGFVALMNFVASSGVKKYMEAEIERFREG